MGSPTARGPFHPPFFAWNGWSGQQKGIDTSEKPVSQLNTQPMVSPVNASRQPSRTAAHHSGPERLARPYSVEDFHLLSFASLSWRSLILAILVFAGTHGTRAAPQLLGLVSTGSPVDLNCSGGTCSAEFSAFCLQPKRSLPTQGTAYRLAPGSDVVSSTHIWVTVPVTARVSTGGRAADRLAVCRGKRHSRTSG